MKDLNAEKNLEFEAPTWDQIYSALLKLAEAVRKSRFEPDLIVGVSRGGLIPARIMSDLLENPNLATLTAEFYIGIAETRNVPSIRQPISVPVKGKKVLVVDDLADTGRSLKPVTSHIKNQGASEVRTATIYYKPWSTTVPDYYETESRCWIIFPWEQKETVKKIIEKLRTEGRTVAEAKEKLISLGLNRKRVEQFTKEITGKEP